MAIDRLNSMPQSTRSVVGRKMQEIEHNTDRGAYNAVLRQVERGEVHRKALVTEGFLRLEQDVVQQNRISFPVLTQDGGANVTEKRLNISDMFLITHMAMFLYSAGADPSQADRAQAKLVSYDADAVNGGTNDIYALYNGSFSIRVDQTVFFDRYDALRFYRAGQAQQGLTAPDYFANQWDSVMWGFSPLVPFITLGGRDTNNIDLNLPTNIDLTDNNATVVAMFRGLLIQNAYGEK